MTTRKFHKTTFTVEVLSEEPLGDMELNDLHYEITEGHCSGVIKRETIAINGLTAAKELRKQGSDTMFFQLDEEGNDCDDY